MTFLISFVIRLVQAAAFAAPYVIMGLLVAGTLRVCMQPSRARKVLSGDGISGPLRGWMCGLLVPVCSMGALPVCREFLRMGVSKRVVFGFLLASPLFHPLTLVLGLSVMDVSLFVTLLAASLVAVIVASQLIEQPKEDQSEDGQSNDEAHTAHVPASERSAVDPERTPFGLRRMLAIAVVAMEALRGRYLAELALGLLGAGLVGGLLRPSVVGQALAQEQQWAGALACSLGSAIYMTPEQAIPVLDRMFGHGNSLTAAIALLVCGVGLNPGTLLAIKNMFGWRSLLRGVAMLFGVVMCIGVLANATVYQPVLDSGDAHAGHEGEGHTHAFDNFSRPNLSDSSPFSHGVTIAKNVWPFEGIVAAGLVVLMIVGGFVARSDANHKRLSRFLSPPGTEASASVLHKPFSARWLKVTGIVAFVSVGYGLLLIYFPDTQTTLEEMHPVHSNARFAVSKSLQGEATSSLEKLEQLARRLPIGSLLRGAASGDQRVSAQELRQRIASLRAALDSADEAKIKRSWSAYEESYLLCRDVYIEGRPFVAHPEADEMPDKITDDAERDLYLTPGGIYTEADITANGRQTASQRFAGFRSAHDMNPSVGTLICPITETKANPECIWVVNGKEYQFCCPPCVDEFVRMAKANPALIKEPKDYVKQ